MTPSSRASCPTCSAATARPRSDAQREQIEGYMREAPCPECGGARLKPLSLAVTIDGNSHRRHLAHVHPRRGTGPRSAAHAVRATTASPPTGSSRRSRRARVPARRRPRVPDPRPRRRHAVRRRGPAHPAGLRVGSGLAACSTCSTSRRSACTSATTSGYPHARAACAIWATPCWSSSTTRRPSRPPTR